jgi:hypothetical protein
MVIGHLLKGSDPGQPAPAALRHPCSAAAGTLQDRRRTLAAMTTTRTAVDELLDAIVSATVTPALYTAGARLDATVPNWRFTVTGGDAVAEQYRTWFAHPARFEELHRHPTPTGEVVEYTLTWEEGGVPHAAHHVHVLQLDATGRIAEDHVWCGGRWDAAVLAEMAAAA